MDLTLVNASLAPELAPRRFKFTSRQGRDRRTRLLAAARELLRERRPEDVSFADVCKLAQIPRPSAYHFFPNVEAIFLGIRLLHAETIISAATALNDETFTGWPDYLARLIDVGVEVTRAEPAFTRLIYGYGASDAEIYRLGQDLDARLAHLARRSMERRFVLPAWDTQEAVFAVTFTIVDSLLKLSYRQWGEITAWTIEEAKRAATCYLANYLPESCPVRTREMP